MGLLACTLAVRAALATMDVTVEVRTPEPLTCSGEIRAAGQALDLDLRSVGSGVVAGRAQVPRAWVGWLSVRCPGVVPAEGRVWFANQRRQEIVLAVEPGQGGPPRLLRQSRGARWEWAWKAGAAAWGALVLVLAGLLARQGRPPTS